MSELEDNSQIYRLERAIIGIQESGEVVVSDAIDFKQTSEAGVGIFTNR